jgi:hypothetical protein
MFVVDFSGEMLKAVAPHISKPFQRQEVKNGSDA